MINNKLVSNSERDEERVLDKNFGVNNIYKALDEAEIEAEDSNTIYYTHEEMKKMAKKIIDGE